MANIHVENSNVVQVDPAILVPHPRRDEAGGRYDTEEALKNIPPNLAGLYATILEEGIREPLLAQTGTNLLIAGHFRRAIALSEGWDAVPVKYMDVSDEEAYYRMLKDNWERNDSILHDPIAIAKNMLFLALRLQKQDELTAQVTAIELGSSRVSENYFFPTSVILKLGKIFNLSRPMTRRYFQLLRLNDELKKWVSQGKVGIEGGCLLSVLSDQAQNDFYRDYAQQEHVSDKEIKAFRETWKMIADKRGLGFEKAPIDNKMVDEQKDDEQEEPFASDTLWYDDDEEEEETVQQEPRYDRSVTPQPLHRVGLAEKAGSAAISVVHDEENKVLIAVKRLEMTVVRQAGIVQRLGAELRQEIRASKEGIESRGVMHLLDDVDGYKRYASEIIGLLDELTELNQDNWQKTMNEIDGKL